MIVSDFDVHSSLIGPAKAHSPLVVDPDAILACPVATQGFQPVGRGNSKIGQSRRCDHPLESNSCPALDVWWQATARLSIEEPLRIPVTESILHTTILTLAVNNVNR